MTIFIIGFIAAILSWLYLFYRGVDKKSGLWLTARVVYLVVSVIEFYHAIIYALVIFGIFAIGEHSIYLRPLVSLYLLAPALIALVHREEFRKL